MFGCLTKDDCLDDEFALHVLYCCYLYVAEAQNDEYVLVSLQDRV